MLANKEVSASISEALDALEDSLGSNSEFDVVVIFLPKTIRQNDSDLREILEEDPPLLVYTDSARLEEAEMAIKSEAYYLHQEHVLVG